MSASRITIERILRDDDDASGQTIRQWTIQVERHGITIRSRDELAFLMMRTDDIAQFRNDLNRAESLARKLAIDDEQDADQSISPQTLSNVEES